MDFLLIASVFFSCKKELPIIETTSTDAITNTKKPIAKTNGLMNGGSILDGGSQPSGVNALTGLSPLTQLFYVKKDIDGNPIRPFIYIPTNYYVGNLYGQDFFVTINTYSIYPTAPRLGTPVQASIFWMQGGDAFLYNAVVFGGSASPSSLNDGSFNFSYNVFIPSGTMPSTTTQLYIPDPSLAGLIKPDGTPLSVTMFNSNFLTSSGGSNLVVNDAGKIICTGDGGFAFTETGWTGSAVVPTNATGVGGVTVSGYTIGLSAIISNPLVYSTGPVAYVVASDANGNNVQVKMFSATYSGDLGDDGFHVIGTVTLYNNKVLNIDSWIYP